MVAWSERPVRSAELTNLTRVFKLYFFLKHKSHDSLPKKMGDRFTHASHVLFSFIRTYTREGVMHPEYLDFLNNELSDWSSLDDHYWITLDIRPREIDEIELSDRVPVTFCDEENEEKLEIRYFPKDGVLYYRYIPR